MVPPGAPPPAPPPPPLPAVEDPNSLEPIDDNFRFLPGDYVWWQFTKREWWPAVVSSLQSVQPPSLRRQLEDQGQPDEDSVLVYTHGDKRYSWVDIPHDDLKGFGVHPTFSEQAVSTFSMSIPIPPLPHQSTSDHSFAVSLPLLQ